jgi:hypothetical protein
MKNNIRLAVQFFSTCFLLIVGCASFADEVQQYKRSSSKSDDQFIVGLECNRHSNSLQLGFFYAYNLPEKRMDLWDTFFLKKNNENGDLVVKVLSVTRSCHLGGHGYKIKITGAPGNWNLNGDCGGVTYAAAKIWKNGKLIFDEALSTCSNEPPLRSITFFAGNDTPIKKQGRKLSDLDP